MKFFVFIVLSLIGTGVYLRFQNDINLKETSVGKPTRTHSQTSNQKEANDHLRPTHTLSPAYLKEGNVHDSADTQENQLIITSGSEFHNNENVSEGFACPFTDINGLCISEPVENYDNLENDIYADAEGSDIMDDMQPPENHQYGKYLNEQTFDSIRVPASEE
jgi:hypothetical protein